MCAPTQARDCATSMKHSNAGRTPNRNACHQPNTNNNILPAGSMMLFNAESAKEDSSQPLPVLTCIERPGGWCPVLCRFFSFFAHRTEVDVLVSEVT